VENVKTFQRTTRFISAYQTPDAPVFKRRPRHVQFELPKRQAGVTELETPGQRAICTARLSAQVNLAPVTLQLAHHPVALEQQRRKALRLLLVAAQRSTVGVVERVVQQLEAARLNFSRVRSDDHASWCRAELAALLAPLHGTLANSSLGH